MIDDLYQDGTDQVLADMVRRPKPEPPKQPPGQLAGLGDAITGNMRAGSAKALAFGADLAGAFGSVVGASPEGFGLGELTTKQQAQAAEAHDNLLKDGANFRLGYGDPLRRSAADWMPDPLTTGHTAQVIGGLFGFGAEYGTTALFGGPAAPYLFGAATYTDEKRKLEAEGVKGPALEKAATLTGVGNAAMTALPMVFGPTRIARAVSGLLLGEGAMVGQTAAVQTILQHAGYDKIASQYDPFDPWLLAMGALPGFLGAAHAPRLASVVKTLESNGQRYGKDGKILEGPATKYGTAKGEMQVVDSTNLDPGFGVKPADRSGTPEQQAAERARVGDDYIAAMQKRYGDDAKALAAYNWGPGNLDKLLAKHPDDWQAHLPKETAAYLAKGRAVMGAEQALKTAIDANPAVVDAARVTQTAQTIDRARLSPDGDLAGSNAHTAAIELAHDQMANGEPVNVAHLVDGLDPTKVVAAIDRMQRPETPALDDPHIIANLPPEARGRMHDLYAEAAREKPRFDESIRSIAEEVGGRPVLAPLKGTERATAKIKSDYGGDPSQIKDLLRATIEADSASSAQRAVAAIFERHEVAKGGRRNLLDPNVTPIDGYRDAKFNVIVNGHVAEVQINLPEMIAAKKEAHHFYEEREALKRKIGPVVPTEAQLAKIDALNASMRAIYEPAWERALARDSSTSALNSASLSGPSSGAPFRLADEGSNARGGSVSQANEYANPGMPSETGVPSTSNSSARPNDAGSGTGFMGSSDPSLPPGVAKEDAALHQSMQARVDDLVTKTPDMQVALPDGTTTTLKDALAKVDAEFAGETSDATLAQVAAECFLGD